MSDFNTEGLDALIKALKGQMGKVQVGILGDKTNRDGELTNAQVGFYHEVGAGNNPIRSFLRMPIANEFPSRLDESGAFDEDALKKVVKQKSATPWLKKIALVAENTVREAFETQGFGEWPQSNYDNKKNEQTLVETQQLRDSITSRVTK
jgi:hypothetical protein